MRVKDFRTGLTTPMDDGCGLMSGVSTSELLFTTSATGSVPNIVESGDGFRTQIRLRHCVLVH